MKTPRLKTPQLWMITQAACLIGFAGLIGCQGHRQALVSSAAPCRNCESCQSCGNASKPASPTSPYVVRPNAPPETGEAVGETFETAPLNAPELRAPGHGRIDTQPDPILPSFGAKGALKGIRNGFFYLFGRPVESRPQPRSARLEDYPTRITLRADSGGRTSSTGPADNAPTIPLTQAADNGLRLHPAGENPVLLQVPTPVQQETAPQSTDEPDPAVAAVDEDLPTIDAGPMPLPFFEIDNSLDLDSPDVELWPHSPGGERTAD